MLVSVDSATDLVSAPVPGGENRQPESHPSPGKVRLAGSGRAVETHGWMSGADAVVKADSQSSRITHVTHINNGNIVCRK